MPRAWECGVQLEGRVRESGCQGSEGREPLPASSCGVGEAASACWHWAALCQENESEVVPSSAPNAPVAPCCSQREAKVLPVACEALPC